MLTDLGGLSFHLGWFNWADRILLQCPGLECCSGEQQWHSGAPLPLSEDVWSPPQRFLGTFINSLSELKYPNDKRKMLILSMDKWQDSQMLLFLFNNTQDTSVYYCRKNLSYGISKTHLEEVPPCQVWQSFPALLFVLPGLKVVLDNLHCSSWEHAVSLLCIPWSKGRGKLVHGHNRKFQYETVLLKLAHKNMWHFQSCLIFIAPRTLFRNSLCWTSLGVRNEVWVIWVNLWMAAYSW